MAEGKVRFAHVPKRKHASGRASDWKRVVKRLAAWLCRSCASSLAILWLHSSRSPSRICLLHHG